MVVINNLKKLVLSTLVFTSLVSSKVDASPTSNRVNIYVDRNIVCVHRTNKCYPFAKGSKEYPSPTWDGPQYLTTHITNGFAWQNPLTGQIYNKGTHNLGDTWIEFYHDKDPNSKTYDWRFGFHVSPDLNTPLSLQKSHGCKRMLPKDIIDFSNSLRYLDEFYIIEG